jgi:HAD superfamily hydrolase (TIGR01509 family)|tara:strand:+ start:1784 stop:2488 length:705 start_codon:yes stop_codon:yes gene_type:complete
MSYFLAIILKKVLIMTVKAIIFGSIGTLVETSEFQRQAFNDTFIEAGLDWNWSANTYKSFLKNSGGRQRIENYATKLGVKIDATKLHLRKTEIFDALMNKKRMLLRPGVFNVINYALSSDIKLGFATSTSESNINTVFSAVSNQLKYSDFDFVGNDTMVSNPKPSPDIYKKALSCLQLNAQDCIAIEDTGISMKAALAADLQCVAFPGAFSLKSDFSGATTITEYLSSDYFKNY